MTPTVNALQSESELFQQSDSKDGHGYGTLNLKEATLVVKVRPVIGKVDLFAAKVRGINASSAVWLQGATCETEVQLATYPSASLGSVATGQRTLTGDGPRISAGIRLDDVKIVTNADGYNQHTENTPDSEIIMPYHLILCTMVM